jgi:flavin reductase (DIM6/NTAB) family NADH-FMN oxidoreductase RutF
MIVFDPLEHPPDRAQGMMSQIIAPRPIAMISTANADGLVNVAPFSYFMAVTGRPLLLAVTMGLRASDAGEKDTWRNVQRTGEFVVNSTVDSMRTQIEIAAMEFPHEISELDVVPWTPIPSQRVSAPSIAESPAHMECRVHRTMELGEPGVRASQVHLVVAEVLCIVMDESICTPDYRVDQRAFAPIGRMGFPHFTRTAAGLYQQTRIPYEEYAATGKLSEVIDG